MAETENRHHTGVASYTKYGQTARKIAQMMNFERWEIGLNNPKHNFDTYTHK